MRMQRFVSSVLGLALLSILSACQSPTASSELGHRIDGRETHTFALEPSREDLATAVARAYAEIKTLQFEMSVTQQKDAIRVKCFMEPARLRTEAYGPAGLFAVFLLNNGVMTEFGEKFTNGSGDVSWQRHEYPPPLPQGTDDAYFKTPFGCLFGTCMQTWLGPDAPQSSLIHDRIRNGKIVARMPFDGADCIVVRHIISYGNNGHHRDDYWIDSVTYIVRRWISEDHGGLMEPVVKRDRMYCHMILNQQIPDDEFLKSPEN